MWALSKKLPGVETIMLQTRECGTARGFKMAFRFFWVWFSICAVLGLGTFGGLVYIAIHFLKKVW